MPNKRVHSSSNSNLYKYIKDMLTYRVGPRTLEMCLRVTWMVPNFCALLFHYCPSVCHAKCQDPKRVSYGKSSAFVLGNKDCLECSQCCSLTSCICLRGWTDCINFGETMLHGHELYISTKRPNFAPNYRWANASSFASKLKVLEENIPYFLI